MELFRDIHEALRDKSADNLYAHLVALGIQAEMLHEHPLQKVGVKTSSWIGFPTRQSRSLGLVKVHGKNIGYVNCVRDVVGGGPGSREKNYLEYLVPLRETPLGMCWAILETKKRGLFRRKVVDIEWTGGTLADMLNGDLTLKDNLLNEFQLNSPLDITVAPEPVYRCARIETGEHRLLSLPSGNLFDCIDRVAGLTAEYVAEVNSRPETVLLEAKIEFNPGSRDAEVANCYVTNRHLRIESREPFQIPLYMVEECSVPMPTLSYGTIGMPVSTEGRVTLRYIDESGHRRKMEFEMPYSDASCLDNELRDSYPRGITR